MAEMTERYTGGLDYDKSWETRWGDMRRYGPTGRHIRRIIHDMISGLPYDSVLDVGCGQGSLLATVMPIRPEARYAGVDFSEGALEVAKLRAPQAEFAPLDITAGHLDRRFDLVLCTDVIEHIEDDVTALRNVSEMAGRYLLVSTLQGRMRPFEATVGHYRNYRYGELQQRLDGLGFDLERVVEWGFPFFSPLYRDFLNVTRGQGTEGHYGTARRIAAHALYQLFRLNSWSRGDYIFLLGRRR